MEQDPSPVITDRLTAALREFGNRIANIDVLSVTSTEGFPILGYSPSGQKLKDDELAIVSARVDTLSKSIRREIRQGELDEAVVSTEDGFFMVVKAGTRGLLTVIFKMGATRDYVTPQVKELANRIGRILEGKDVQWRELVRARVQFDYIPSQLLTMFARKVNETLMPAVAGRITYDSGFEFAREIISYVREEINPKFPLDSEEFTQFVTAVIEIVTNGLTDAKMLARTPTEFLTTVHKCVFCADRGREMQCKFIEGIINGLYIETTGKQLKVKESKRRRGTEDSCEIFFVTK